MSEEVYPSVTLPQFKAWLEEFMPVPNGKYVPPIEAFREPSPIRSPIVKQVNWILSRERIGRRMQPKKRLVSAAPPAMPATAS